MKRTNGKKSTRISVILYAVCTILWLVLSIITFIGGGIGTGIIYLSISALFGFITALYSRPQ